MQTGTRGGADSRRLIVNADDFGLSESTNKGILDAHLHGIVTGSGLLLNMPALSDAVDRARRNPGLDTGIHINLTWGRPIRAPGRIPTLVGKDGRFAGTRALIFSLLAGRVKASHLEEEVRAQIEKFLGTGLTPYHMDTHQHLHAIPSVMRVLVKMTSEYAIPCLRVPRERLSPHPTALAVRLFLMISTRETGADSGIVSSDYFTGIALTGKWNEKKKEKVRRLIFSLRPGITELMCHPGYADPGLVSFSRLVEERREELNVLTSPILKKWMREAGVSLTSYRDVVEERRSSAHCTAHE
jgi:chitin disaccharide deacetylase